MHSAAFYDPRNNTKYNIKKIYDFRHPVIDLHIPNFSMTICVNNDCISKNGYGYRWTLAFYHADCKWFSNPNVYLLISQNLQFIQLNLQTFESCSLLNVLMYYLKDIVIMSFEIYREILKEALATILTKTIIYVLEIGK
jgi:hypothetical protein